MCCGGNVGSAWFLALLILAANPQRRRKRVIAKHGGFTWTREDFCRGWIITCDTGSG